jgi:hypothetical protein
MTAAETLSLRCPEFREGDTPTLDDVRQWAATCSLPAACAAIGLSKSFGYQLVTENQFPCRVIKRGKRIRVVTAALLALLEAE